MAQGRGQDIKLDGTELDRTSVSQETLSVKSRKENIMKIFLKLPHGIEFQYQREPMEDSHFYVLCGLIALAMFFISCS